MGIIMPAIKMIARVVTTAPLIIPFVAGGVSVFAVWKLIPAISTSLIIFSTLVGIGICLNRVLSGLGDYKAKSNQIGKEKERIIYLSKDGENLRLDKGQNIEDLWKVITLESEKSKERQRR